MVYIHKIREADGNGVFNLIHANDFEYVNPEQNFLERFLVVNTDFFWTQAIREIPPFLRDRMTEADKRTIMMGVLKRANAESINELDRLNAIQLPSNLLSLFIGLRKKDEQKIFKDFLLTPDVFLSFILKAGQFGYKYSLYTFNQYPSNINATDIPRFAHRDEENDTLFFTNETNLSKGQVNSLIAQRTTTVVKILDKGPLWHCFFLTFKGVAGKEKDHPSHMHYLSSAWGLTRDDALAELRRKNYSIPSVHVWYDKH